MSARDDEARDRRDLVGSTSALTFHRLASIDAAIDRGGRFSDRTISTVMVTGSEPAVHYPRQPPGSPYAGDGVPNVEPPTGVDINAQEPVGTEQEILASIEALDAVVGSNEGASIAAPTVAPISAVDVREGGDALENADGVSSSFTNPQQSRASPPTKSPPSTSLRIKRRKGL